MQGLQLIKLASLREGVDDKEGAIKILKSILDQNLFTPNSKEEYIVIRDLCRLYNLTENYIFVLPLVIRQFESMQDKKSREYAKTLHQYGIALKGLKRFDEAETMLTHASLIYEYLGLQNTYDYAQIFVTRARRKMGEKLYKEALVLLQKADDIFCTLKHCNIYTSALYDMALCYQALRQPKEIEQILLKAKKGPKTGYYVKVLLMLADYYSVRQPHLTLPLLYEARIYSTKFNNKDRIEKLISSTKKVFKKDPLRIQRMQTAWLEGRRNDQQCDCCRDYFAILNVSEEGILYCNGEECKKLFYA